MNRRRRTASPAGTGKARSWRPAVVSKNGRSRTPRAEGDKALAARLGRIRKGLYGLYADLSYFATSPQEHRDLLRRRLNWPDVGHITSLARALAEEDRFYDWVRFNGYVQGQRGEAGPLERTA